MVLLVKIQEAAIVENLKKRFFDDLIYVSYYMFYFWKTLNEGLGLLLGQVDPGSQFPSDTGASAFVSDWCPSVVSLACMST